MGSTGIAVALQQLTASVGRGGANRTSDVALVQHLLNIVMPGAMPRLAEDGICGNATVLAILNYQRMLRMNPPDGRIDPGGRTFAALLAGPNSSPTPDRPAPTAAATPQFGVFPATVIQAAVASLLKWKVPASVTLAQWAIESNWGRTMPPASNNPFGIKAAPGQDFVECPTHEVKDGQTITIVDRFRKFASLTEAFDLHGQLIATAAPYKSVMTHTGDSNAFADALTGIYATAPNYGTVLKSVMKQYNLYQYDQQS